MFFPKKNIKLALFIFLILCLFENYSFAKANEIIKYKKIEGFAQVIWEKGKYKLSSEQIILITPESFSAKMIDAFGNQLYEIDLDSEVSLIKQDQNQDKEINRLLKLKITPQEFLASLTIFFQENELKSVIKKKEKSKLFGKKYKLTYSDFKLYDSLYYPHKIVLKSGKTSLTIYWQTLNIKL